MFIIYVSINDKKLSVSLIYSIAKVSMSRIKKKNVFIMEPMINVQHEMSIFS